MSNKLNFLSVTQRDTVESRKDGSNGGSVRRREEDLVLLLLLLTWGVFSRDHHLVMGHLI